MPTLGRHAPGSFCWVELVTPDQTAAKAFYGSLFSWVSQDQPIGPSDFYTIFRLSDRSAAAARKLGADERQADVPPHWTLYIAVESADDIANRAASLGGRICAGPLDVFDAGRMAMLFDPSGGPFAVWEPKRNTGIGIERQSAAFCWADLSTPRPETALKFYTGLLGWTTSPGQSGYLHIRNGDEFIGGVPAAEHRDANIPPHWLLYFQTADCVASSQKAGELGATIVSGPVNMENIGTLAVVADPQGAVFALFQPK